MPVSPPAPLPSRRSALCLLAVLASPASALAAGKSKEEPLDSYLRVAALAAGVRLTGGRRGVIMMEPGVDAPDPAMRAKVEAALPRLRAGWFAVLQRYASGLRPGMAPDVDSLSRQMQSETDRVLGGKGARFLIGSVLVH